MFSDRTDAPTGRAQQAAASKRGARMFVRVLDWAMFGLPVIIAVGFCAYLVGVNGW